MIRIIFTKKAQPLSDFEALSYGQQVLDSALLAKNETPIDVLVCNLLVWNVLRSLYLDPKYSCLQAKTEWWYENTTKLRMDDQMRCINFMDYPFDWHDFDQLRFCRFDADECETFVKRPRDW